jgi:hypothetical protein
MGIVGPNVRPKKAANKKGIQGWDMSSIKNRREAIPALSKQAGIKTISLPR